MLWVSLWLSYRFCCLHSFIYKYSSKVVCQWYLYRQAPILMWESYVVVVQEVSDVIISRCFNGIWKCFISVPFCSDIVRKVRLSSITRNQSGLVIISRKCAESVVLRSTSGLVCSNKEHQMYNIHFVSTVLGLLKVIWLVECLHRRNVHVPW